MTHSPTNKMLFVDVIMMMRCLSMNKAGGVLSQNISSSFLIESRIHATQIIISLTDH